MRIAIAYADRDGTSWPDQAYAAAMEAWLVHRGHSVEQIVIPISSHRSPQEQALACQLAPTDAYGDELWTLNFPACLLPHSVRRIWLTRAEPFGSDARAPAAAFARLLTEGATSVTVASDVLRRQLGLSAETVEIGLPVVPAREQRSSSPARNGNGLLLMADSLPANARPAALETLDELRQAGIASWVEMAASDADFESQSRALAAASAVVVRENDIARLFDHALLAIRVGTPVLLIGDDGRLVGWHPKGGEASSMPPVNLAFGEIADTQSQWLDEAITSACTRMDTETQAVR